VAKLCRLCRQRHSAKDFKQGAKTQGVSSVVGDRPAPCLKFRCAKPRKANQISRTPFCGLRTHGRDPMRHSLGRGIVPQLVGGHRSGAAGIDGETLDRRIGTHGMLLNLVLK